MGGKMFREILCTLFIQLPSILTSFRTIVKYHNQEIDCDPVHRFYLNVTSFTHKHAYFACMFVCECVFPCNIYAWNIRHHQDTEKFHHHEAHL